MTPEVLIKQVNDDKTECVVVDNGDGKCTIYIGRPRPTQTITVKKEKLLITLKAIKEGRFKKK